MVGVLFAWILRFESIRGKDLSIHIVYVIIEFVALLLWCWGAATIVGIVRFISACIVGQWWFGNSAEPQYTLGTSIKRAFTTNFGTICSGSLHRAVIKPERSSIKQKTRTNVLASDTACVFQSQDKVVDDMNEWAFVYTALTGQSFGEASR
ncbi:unnamed protein product, partial [Rotaria sp. Silwood1]